MFPVWTSVPSCSQFVPTMAQKWALQKIAVHSVVTNFVPSVPSVPSNFCCSKKFFRTFEEDFRRISSFFGDFRNLFLRDLGKIIPNFRPIWTLI